MNFADAKIDVVRSVNQKALALYWDRLTRDTRLPSLQLFEPSAREMDPALLMITSVEKHGDGFRYLIHHYGLRLVEASGVDGNGKYLDVILPEALRLQALATYDQCRIAECPIYTVAVTVDIAGREVQYERLLLPFSDAGQKVDHIVSFLHLISIEGNFVRKGILGGNAAPITYLIAAQIAPGFSSRKA